MISPRKAAVVLFLEGFVSSALQMTTIRQTTPFVGSSVLSTSVVISVFLAALAIGYYAGGRSRIVDYPSLLRRNIYISVLFFGIGHSYPFVKLFFDSFSNLFPQGGIFLYPLTQLFLFCFFIMSPLVFFLGQTVPLLLNSWSEEVRKSEAAGNATALSTVGNVFGCLICSLVLMYFLGVGFSITFNCAILFLCIYLLRSDSLVRDYFFVFYLLLFFPLIFAANVGFEKRVFTKTTPYSNINIHTNDFGKELIINRSRSSFLSKSDKKGWPYIETMKNALFDKLQPGSQALVLGAGGFTLSAEGSRGVTFNYVDVDDQLRDVAEKYFLEGAIDGKFIPQDARSFLLSNSTKWDAVVVDLYSNASMMPGHTVTLEFFSLINQRLKDDGLLVMNVIANPQLNDAFSISIDATIRAAFSKCITDISAYQDGLVNVVYFCHRRSSRDGLPVATLYTDDTTRATVDSYLLSLRSLR